MRVWVIGAALVLAGCSGEPSQDNVKKMLEANDPMVCASADVQRTALTSIVGGYQEYITAGGKQLAFEGVNSTGLNKDINEVSCSAVVRFPPMVVGTESLPDIGVPINYTVRPSLGDDSEFIVNASSSTGYLTQRLGVYILSNTKGVEENAPPSISDSGPAQEFTGSEAALIASANDAWVGYRNGEPDAEAKFDQLLDQLLKGGICWGEVGQSQAEYKFHRCGSNSLQKQPAPAAGSDEAMCNAGDHDACMRL